MSQTLQLIKELVARGEVRISEHGYDALAADNILVEDILYGVAAAHLVADYPEYFKGPSALVLQNDPGGLPIHGVCGCPKGAVQPAVAVPASRAQKEQWSD